MSQYKPYSRYKSSSYQWINQIPNHWEEASLKWLATRYAGGTPDKTNLDFWENGTIPWVNSGSVNQALITEPSALITEEAYLNSSAKWVPQGSLLMALAGQGKTKGMVAQTAIKTTCNQSMAAICPQERCHGRFLYWWLSCQYRNLRGLAGDGLRDGLNLEMLGSVPCPLPPLDEQKSIATFLDRETARIDALIEKKQRQIELLKEKRQAIITQAVTKGLDPDVPLKDSGVEWLGEVPEHWGVVSLRWLMRIGSGEFLSNVDFAIESDESKNIPVIGGNGIAGYTSKAIFENALVIGRVGALCGNVHYINSPCWVTDNALVVKNLGTFDAEFLTFSFKMLDLNRLANQNAQPLVTGEMIKKQKVAVPPLNEQCQITNHINKELLKSDNLVEKTEKSIVLLKERRSALITAAVTGQIDVREEV